nr:dihydropyrimidine dehydrogenase (NADP(+)), chloroplastic [Tanacetum cinerariifolium]
MHNIVYCGFDVDAILVELHSGYSDNALETLFVAVEVLATLNLDFATTEIVPEVLDFAATWEALKIRELVKLNKSDSELNNDLEDKNDNELESDSADKNDDELELEQFQDHVRFLAKMFKKMKQLPRDWKYDRATAGTFVAIKPDNSAIQKMTPPTQKGGVSLYPSTIVFSWGLRLLIESCSSNRTWKSNGYCTLMMNEFPNQHLSIFGIGGVETGSDAAEFILLGANTVLGSSHPSSFVDTQAKVIYPSMQIPSKGFKQLQSTFPSVVGYWHIILISI